MRYVQVVLRDLNKGDCFAAVACPVSSLVPLEVREMPELTVTLSNGFPTTREV